MAVALCHYFVSSSPLASEPQKRVRRGRSSSWESFVAAHPEREIKTTKK